MNEYINLTEDDELNFFMQDMENNLDSDELLLENKMERLVYFHKYVRELYDGGYSYLEAIVQFSKEHDLDLDSCTNLISDDLRQDIYNEAVKSKMIKPDTAINNIGL